MEHEEDTGDREDDEKEARDSSEAEGVRELKAVPLYLRGEDMEEKVVIDQQGSFQIRIRYSGPEDGTPWSRI
jgi:hypothetical protein